MTQVNLISLQQLYSARTERETRMALLGNSDNLLKRRNVNKQDKKFDKFPIHLNFGKFCNSATLSDVKLLATLQKNEISKNVVNSEVDQSMSSLDDDNNDNNSDNGLIHGHWDILRSRCIIFDLIFHAYCHGKAFENETISFFVATPVLCKDKKNRDQFPIISIKTSEEALKLVINYLYTGIIRNREFDENIGLAKQTLELCDILHLPNLRKQLRGTFTHSRKQMRDISSQNDNNKEETFLKYESYFPYKSYQDWMNGNLKDSFFNVKVLYNTNVVLYDPRRNNKLNNSDSKVNCKLVPRQWIEVENGDMYCISKFIFYCLSKYFRALLDHDWMENQQACVMKLQGINSNEFNTIMLFFYTFETSIFHFDENEHKLPPFLNTCQEKECDEKKDIIMQDENEEILKNRMLKQLFSYLNICDFFMINDLRSCILSMMETHYVDVNNLYKIWKYGLNHLNLQLSNHISNICQTYFQNNFERITCQHKQVFYKLNKIMLKNALSNGKIELNTNSMIQVLCDWVKYHNQNSNDKHVNLCELLPPNTLFNRANKTFVLHNRQPMNLHHFLSLPH